MVSLSNHRPESFGSPFALSLSKGERFTQDRRVEGEKANCDTVSEGGGLSPAPHRVQDYAVNLTWFTGGGWDRKGARGESE